MRGGDGGRIDHRSGIHFTSPAAPASRTRPWPMVMKTRIANHLSGWVLLAGLLGTDSPVSAGDADASRREEMLYVYNGPESPLDHRYDYHWQVLREALEKTRPKFGSYRMEAAGYMSEDRQVFELQNRTGKLNV